MTRTIVIVFASLLVASCSGRGKSKPKPDVSTAEAKDAGPSADGAPPPAPLTNEQLRALFSKAYYCRSTCPERDQMRAMMKAYRDQVAEMAIGIFAEPGILSGQGLGQEAIFFLDDYFRKHHPNDEARSRAAKALEKVIVEGKNEDMRAVAFSYFVEHRLPGAERLLLADLENPALSLRQRASAGGSLGSLVDDFGLFRRWLQSDQPHLWLAGMFAIPSYNSRHIRLMNMDEHATALHEEQRKLVIALGKRDNLPGDVVEELASFYGAFLNADPDDAEVLALATRWSKHPDDRAAGAMENALARGRMAKSRPPAP